MTRLTTTWSVKEVFSPPPQQRVQYHPFPYALFAHIVQEYHLISILADEIRDEIDREILENLLVEMRQHDERAFNSGYKALGVVQ